MGDAHVQGDETKNTQLQVYTSRDHPGSRLSLQARSKKDCFQLLYSRQLARASCQRLSLGNQVEERPCYNPRVAGGYQGPRQRPGARSLAPEGEELVRRARLVFGGFTPGLGSGPKQSI